MWLHRSATPHVKLAAKAWFGMRSAHGGEIQSAALRLGVSPAQLLDASASLVPWTPRFSAQVLTRRLRDYPDRHHHRLADLIGKVHGLSASAVLPGNGAAELFTWAARDAAAVGMSSLPVPGFADYSRALACWDGAMAMHCLSLDWSSVFPQAFSSPGTADVLWICNPHNPTGQLWSRSSLEPLLHQHRLVICDEAFLSLVPDGEQQSLIPLVSEHPNLVVIRSLTKLYGIAGLRLGYAVAPQTVGLTPYEAVVLASLIEREARVGSERAKISRVIHNRLAADWYLGIDASIVYFTGDNELTVTDLQTESPFNTRLSKGLPPTPIAAPGKAALEAAMAPVSGQWMFYVLADSEGRHNFSVSSDEFERDKAKCQERGLC